MSRNFGEQFDKIREVITKEFGAKDERFTSVLGKLFGTEKLNFAGYAEGGSSVGGLYISISHRIVLSASNSLIVAYMESETLESLSKARKCLVSCARS